MQEDVRRNHEDNSYIRSSEFGVTNKDSVYQSKIILQNTHDHLKGDAVVPTLMVTSVENIGLFK